jgi:HK97 family phage major capsid protein
MNRAYVALSIKAVDEDSRQIEGWASTVSVDRVGDVVVPKGAVYKLPLPFLLDHNSTQVVGEVDRAEVTDKGIKFWAHIKKIAEPGEVKDLCDKAWSLVKNGLRKSVSIGFHPLDFEALPGGGLKFVSWEWLELSAVGIPANAEAQITTIKDFSKDARYQTVAVQPPEFDTGAPAATGHIERPANPPGASGKPTKTVKSLAPKEKPMAKTIAEQISAFEATRAAKAAELETIMTTTEGETLDADAAEAADGLTSDLKSIDDHLKRLRLVETLKAQSAKPVTGVENEKTGSEARVPAQVKSVQKLAPGIGFARLAKVKALSRLDGESPRVIAKNLYGEDSAVFGVVSKAAVAAGTTGGWASFLVGDESSVFADFVEYLRPQTILGRFGANGVPSLRRVPFRTALLSQTGKGTGYWVGEGKAKPLTSITGERTTLEPLKVANIAVVTEEVLRDSSPSAEMILRDELAAALRERLDTDFIDPAKSATANISPASILNGVSAIGSSGTDADAVRVDIQAIFGAFIAANNAPTSGVWIMPATMALSMSLMQNPLGQPEFPGINMSGGTFFGLPVIVSEYMPTITGGSYVALVNAQDIYLADDGQVTVDMSREASLQMDNEPTMTSDSPTGTSVVSLWQTNSVGFRAERTINWARRRDSAVAVLSGVAWAQG